MWVWRRRLPHYTWVRLRHLSQLQGHSGHFSCAYNRPGRFYEEVAEIDVVGTIDGIVLGSDSGL